jgi:hypothetical protein
LILRSGARRHLPNQYHLSKHNKCHRLYTRCWYLRVVRKKHLNCNKRAHYFVHCQ